MYLSGGRILLVHPHMQIVWLMLSRVTTGLIAPGVMLLSGTSAANAAAADRARANVAMAVDLIVVL